MGVLNFSVKFEVWVFLAVFVSFTKMPQWRRISPVSGSVLLCMSYYPFCKGLPSWWFPPSVKPII